MVALESQTRPHAVGLERTVLHPPLGPHNACEVVMHPRAEPAGLLVHSDQRSASALQSVLPPPGPAQPQREHSDQMWRGSASA
eukprot:625586-Prymnesium_polylepis.1